MADSNMKRDLTSGSILKGLLLFSIPFLISNILQALYGVIDLIIVSNFSTIQAVNGVNIGGQVIVMVTNIVVGFSIGGTVLIAQYTGARKTEECKDVIATQLTIFIIASIAVMALLLIFAKPILVLLDTPKSAIDEGMSYLTISSFGMIFIFGYNAIAGILRGLGDSKRPLYFVLVATIINLVLDIVFVKYLNMGAGGAALATVIAQASSFIFAIFLLLKQKFLFELKFKNLKIHKNSLRLITKIGLPSALQQAIIQVSFLFIMFLVNSFGENANAAYGFAIKINSFAILPLMAMMSSISAMAGQNIGAQNYKRAKQVYLTAIAILLPFMIALYSLVNVFSHPILGIFTKSEEIIGLGQKILISSSIEYIICSFLFCAHGLLSGAGKTTFILINSIISSIVVRVPLGYLFTKVLDMGVFGIGLSIGLSPIIPTIIAVIISFTNYWKKSLTNKSTFKGVLND